MRVEFVVDELVLIGFDPRERHRLADAIERELVAQLNQAHASDIAAGAELANHESTLHASDVRLSATANSANAIGRGVSRSIVSAIVGGGSQGSTPRGSGDTSPSPTEGR
ncbi:MAG: hypothetical protein ABJC26_16355 [Gemmatimonadaceae bacterium]